MCLEQRNAADRLTALHGVEALALRAANQLAQDAGEDALQIGATQGAVTGMANAGRLDSAGALGCLERHATYS